MASPFTTARFIPPAAAVPACGTVTASCAGPGGGPTGGIGCPFNEFPGGGGGGTAVASGASNGETGAAIGAGPAGVPAGIAPGGNGVPPIGAKMSLLLSASAGMP